MKLMIFTSRTCFVMFLFVLLRTQECSAQQAYTSFSNPIAPVGDTALTPSLAIKPLLDVWMRDTYIMLGPDGQYYLTGTTATPGRVFQGQKHCWDFNDGIYLWRSSDLKTWDSIGRIWSFDEHGAEWQKKGKPIKKGNVSVNNDQLDSMYRAVWAPEVHYIKSKDKWLLIACLNGNQGSFVLESTSGKPEGPYRNIKGNKTGPIFDNIDLSVYEDEDDAVYLVGHNHYIARMKDDLSDVAEPFRAFQETPYSKEPYIEGAWLTKHDGKYQLLQTVWSVALPNGTYTYLPAENKNQKVYSYDVVVAESEHIYGPYGPRYPAILGAGHNNLFQDKNRNWWATTFFNPRGIMGQLFPINCRPAIVPVTWENGRLKPKFIR